VTDLFNMGIILFGIDSPHGVKGNLGDMYSTSDHVVDVPAKRYEKKRHTPFS
jgi:hypothetical protein